MAKTIHDLAVDYGKNHLGTVDIEVFEAGANAVIKEIMDCFPTSPFIVPKETLEAIVNRIKELKEE